MIDWVIFVGQILILAYFMWMMNRARRSRDLHGLLCFGVMVLVLAVWMAANGIIQAQPDQIVVDIHSSKGANA